MQWFLWLIHDMMSFAVLSWQNWNSFNQLQPIPSNLIAIESSLRSGPLVTILIPHQQMISLDVFPIFNLLCVNLFSLLTHCLAGEWVSLLNQDFLGMIHNQWLYCNIMFQIKKISKVGCANIMKKVKDLMGTNTSELLKLLWSF